MVRPDHPNRETLALTSHARSKAKAAAAEALGEIEIGGAYVDSLPKGPRVYGETIPTQAAGWRAARDQAPTGVCGANHAVDFPCFMITRKVSRRLAAGALRAEARQ